MCGCFDATEERLGARDVFVFGASSQKQVSLRLAFREQVATPRRAARFGAFAGTMADLLEEQAMEVEALESILMEDMRVVEGSEAIAGATHAPCYQIAVSALGDGEEEDPDDATQTARLGLVFSHTPTYPETPPLLRCRSIEGLFDKELVEVTDLLRTHAEGLVGMAMIFDLVTEAKEWMRGRAGVVDVVEETPEMLQRRLEEEAEERDLSTAEEFELEELQKKEAQYLAVLEKAQAELDELVGHVEVQPPNTTKLGFTIQIKHGFGEHCQWHKCKRSACF